MRLTHRLVAQGRLLREEPAIRRAQLGALAKQMRLLFVVLFATALALSLTHLHTAPAWLTILMPITLLPICILRTLQWRAMRIETLDDATMLRRLRVSTAMTVGLSGGMVIWAFALFPFSSAAERIDTVFFLAMLIVSTIFCMIHLRFAAPIMACTVVLPTCVALLVGGGFVSSIVAIDLLVITAVMTVNATGYHRDFRRLNKALFDLAVLSATNERDAQVDSLTGLGNRRGFFAEVEAAIDSHADTGRSFALGLIDLDGFKPVNDMHGHSAGDEVLAEIGRRLRDALPPTAVSARIGGDEFAILLPGISDPSEAEASASVVCVALAAPIALASGQVRVEASLGLALFPSMAATRDRLFEFADVALYHAKARSRGRAVLFSREHAEKVRAQRLMTHALRWADLDHEFSLVFQPIVDIAANRVTTFEALARWTSPSLGSVSPADFIPLAERLGIVGGVTSTLFRKACAVAKTWPETIRLSFNLSGLDLADDGAIERLRHMVETSGLHPKRLVFEVTETAVIQDFDRASAALQALRALGCKIALDDFGTGFSSLSHVHRLPLDKLKIDASFVRTLAVEQASRSIVKSTIDLAASLGLACVVEGVETQAQADMVAAMGCHAMQGWLFGMPISEADMLRGDFPVAAFARAGSRTKAQARRAG